MNRPRPGLEQCLHRRQPDRVAAVGDEDAPELRIGGHLPPLPIVLHRGCLLLRPGESDRLAALVELKRHRHPLALDTIAMEMGHHHGPAVELDEADAPGRPLPEVDIRRHAHRRLGDEHAAARGLDEGQVGRKAFRADFARGIGELPAMTAFLQGEAAFGRGGSEAMRNAAARGRRQRGQPRAVERAALARRRERLRHALGPVRMAAPEERPRS